MPQNKKPESFGEGDAPVEEFGQGDTPVNAEKPSAMQRFGSGLADSTLGAFKGFGDDPLGTTGRIIRGLGNSIAPIPSNELISSAYQHLTTPGERGKLGSDLKEGIRDNPVVGGAVPIAEDVQQGNLAGAAGRAVGTGLTLAAPKLAGSAARGLGIPEAMAPVRRVMTSPDVMEKAGNVIPFMNMGTKLRGLGQAVSQAAKSTGVPPPPPVEPPNAPALPRRIALPAPTKPEPVPPPKRVAPPPLQGSSLERMAPPPEVAKPRVAPPPLRGSSLPIIEKPASETPGPSISDVKNNLQASIAQRPVVKPLPNPQAQSLAQQLAQAAVESGTVTPEMVGTEVPPPVTPQPASSFKTNNRRIK